MKIGRPQVTTGSGTARISAEFEYSGQRRALWYEVPAQYAEGLTPERSDAFLMALLPLAMKQGEDIRCEAPVSEKLFYNLTRYCMHILTLVMPELQPVGITPAGLDSSRLAEARGGVVTAFSGGVDSFCVLADHLFGNVLAGYRVTHLIFNNVGAFGAGGRALFNARHANLAPFASEVGLPFIKVDSNLDEVLPVSFVKTHTIRNASAVLTLQKLFGRYLYASGVAYGDCQVNCAPDVAYVDPLLVPLLSTEATECIPTGSQYSRVEKTEKVTTIELSRRHLNVCASHASGGNCSVCWKCMRVQLTLEILGKLHLYAQVFDMAKYQERRADYIVDVLSNRNHFLREIVRLAVDKAYRFPAYLRGKAMLKAVKNGLRCFLRGRA
jgi:hypothetical protein